MIKAITDNKIYLSAYVGIGNDGRSIADTLKAGARKQGLSLSEFLVRAALNACKTDTFPKKADTQPHPIARAARQDSVDLPPSLRRARSPKARQSRGLVDEDGFPIDHFPAQEDAPPSSKPSEGE